MKILKTIGLVIVGLLVIVMIASFIVSTDFNYEKTITINAPIEVVWENTNSLADLDKWSPWAGLDPNRKMEITGTDGTVGAMQSWESEVAEVGKGNQTITKVEAPNTFNTDLKFLTPYESEAQGFIQLTKNGEGTDITWGFASDMPRPFNLMKLMMDVEQDLGVPFSNGLATLKGLCEN